MLLLGAREKIIQRLNRKVGKAHHGKCELIYSWEMWIFFHTSPLASSLWIFIYFLFQWMRERERDWVKQQGSISENGRERGKLKIMLGSGIYVKLKFYLQTCVHKITYTITSARERERDEEMKNFLGWKIYKLKNFFNDILNEGKKLCI